MTNQIHFWDATLASPAENLAADEALLDACEAGAPQALRFWESPDYFVVLGYSNHSAREANLEACRREQIPVLRRCSGGGAVLQGPGCLNYSLALRIDADAALQTIPGANRFVMERHAEALSAALQKPVTVEGITDLCVGGLKFSGNSQRRLRGALLFHGTFLWNFDLTRVERFLAMPSREPEYRRSRGHAQFLANIAAEPGAIKTAVRQCWDASAPLDAPPEWMTLTHGKYEKDDWSQKF